MLRYLFSYVGIGRLPDVPEVEPTDPNENRGLSEFYRSSRKSLVAMCAVCLAWSTAQFSVQELSIDAIGLTVDLRSASIPVLLSVALAYLSVRWVHEFAMMPRHVRRWRLAQLDFKVVSVVVRFSLLALAAGTLDRSLKSVILVFLAVPLLALVAIILAVPLAFITTAIRMLVRNRANRISAANAVSEGIMWAGVFSIALTVAGTAAFGRESYSNESLRSAIWSVAPSPSSLSVFFFILIITFVSPFLLRPLTSKLFAERPRYYTKTEPDGRQIVTVVDEKQEPLL